MYRSIDPDSLKGLEQREKIQEIVSDSIEDIQVVMSDIDKIVKKK